MLKSQYLIISLFLILIAGCSSTTIAIVDEPLDVNITNPSLGFQFNAWNGSATGVNGVSNVIDTGDNPHISIILDISEPSDVSFEVSEDGVHFTLCSQITEQLPTQAGGKLNAHVFPTIGARYIRLKSSVDVIANATVVAKP